MAKIKFTKTELKKQQDAQKQFPAIFPACPVFRKRYRLSGILRVGIRKRSKILLRGLLRRAGIHFRPPPLHFVTYTVSMRCRRRSAQS